MKKLTALLVTASILVSSALTAFAEPCYPKDSRSDIELVFPYTEDDYLDVFYKLLSPSHTEAYSDGECAFIDMNWECPELWDSNSTSYAFLYNIKKPGYDTETHQSLYRVSEISSMKEETNACYQWLKSLQAAVPEDMPYDQKLAFIRDHICSLLTYDKSQAEGGGMYKTITTGTGVCRHYARLFQAACCFCGVPVGVIYDHEACHVVNYLILNDGSIRFYDLSSYDYNNANPYFWNYENPTYAARIRAVLDSAGVAK